MKYFGIKTVGSYGDTPYMWWISNSEFNAWRSFFRYPDKNDAIISSHTLPLEEAIRAYEAIGYQCIELEITEKGE